MSNKKEFIERPEVFKEIPEMPGYFASNNGRVRKGLTKIIQTHETRKGYITAQIMMDGRRFGIGVHRLVAMAFLGDVKGMEVDHLNFDKKDNRLENLEIVSRAENMRRFHKSGFSDASYKKISSAQKERWSKTERPPAKQPASEDFLNGIEKRKRAPGGGRKPKPPGEKRVKTAITMRPDHYDATAGDRSGIIERALDNMFGWIERAKTTTTSTVEVTTGSKTNEPIKITIKGYKD